MWAVATQNGHKPKMGNNRDNSNKTNRQIVESESDRCFNLIFNYLLSSNSRTGLFGYFLFLMKERHKWRNEEIKRDRKTKDMYMHFYFRSFYHSPVSVWILHGKMATDACIHEETICSILQPIAIERYRFVSWTKDCGEIAWEIGIWRAVKIDL